MIHMIKGTEKSYDLPSASQRPKKASCIISVLVYRPKNCGSPVQGQEKINIHLKQ